MIICIVGLPCSGKTFLSKTIGDWFNLPIVDDPILISFIPKNCIISSPFFCIDSVRDYLIETENKRDNTQQTQTGVDCKTRKRSHTRGT